MEDGRMKQIGITSFGLAFGCELGFHAAFTRVSKYQKNFVNSFQRFNFTLILLIFQPRFWNSLKLKLELKLILRYLKCLILNKRIFNFDGKLGSRRLRDFLIETFRYCEIHGEIFSKQ